MEQELENIDHRLPACPDSLSKTIPDEVFGRDRDRKPARVDPTGLGLIVAVRVMFRGTENPPDLVF